MSGCPCWSDEFVPHDDGSVTCGRCHGVKYPFCPRCDSDYVDWAFTGDAPFCRRCATNLELASTPPLPSEEQTDG